MMVHRSGVPGYSHPRLKQLAIVGLVLHRNPHRHRLEALETGRGFKVGALLTTM